jgi:hypothetical protein
MKFSVCLPLISKGFRWWPHRLTLKCNPAIYRWLWFNWYFGDKPHMMARGR